VVKNNLMELRKNNPQPQPNEAVIDNGVERRFVSEGIEIRAAENGVSTLKGYALRFNSVYDMGWFTEEVDRRALDNANMSDVRILLNHDPNNILGRTTANTARVGVDERGLWYEVDLPDSPNGQNARVAVERGDINQSSWGFRLRQDETGRTVGNRWEKRDGKEHRILTDVAMIFDASPVTFPANPDTSVAKRSLEMTAQEVEKPVEEPELKEGGTYVVRDGQLVLEDEQRTNTEQINTESEEMLLLELTLKEAEIRAQTLNYNYEKICN